MCLDINVSSAATAAGAAVVAAAVPLVLILILVVVSKGPTTFEGQKRIPVWAKEEICLLPSPPR